MRLNRARRAQRPAADTTAPQLALRGCPQHALQRPLREPTRSALFHLPTLDHRGGQCGKPELFRRGIAWESAGELILETTLG